MNEIVVANWRILRDPGDAAAFVVGVEVAKEHAQCRDPEMEAHWGTTQASPFESVDAGLPVRMASPFCRGGR